VSRRDQAIDAAIERVNARQYSDRPKAQWLNENEHFAFNYTWVRNALEARISNKKTAAKSYTYFVGWYLQQLIKLYCGRTIDRVLKLQIPVDTLVIDSDLVFFQDTPFIERATISSGGRCMATYRYAFSREHHNAYLHTNQALLGPKDGALARTRPGDPSGEISGVAHHMVFRADILNAIEQLITSRHHGKQLYLALLDPVAGVIEKPQGNAFSEYQLYFQFARSFFPESVYIRQLYWANGPSPNAVVQCSENDAWPMHSMRTSRSTDDPLQIDASAGYDFVAYHSYAKRRPCVYAPYARDGVCFGDGCTYSCFKRRNIIKYTQLDRRLVAPRLCNAATITPIASSSSADIKYLKR